MNVGVVHGVPKLGKKQPGVYESCQLGKQLKGIHKVLQHITTMRILELLHMDLLGSMLVESTCGKRYVFVSVDNFFNFTWAYFIKEKYDILVFKKLCTKLKKWK